MNNADNKYIIQRMVFPSEEKHMMCRELFYRGEAGFLDRDGQSLTIGTGQKCDLTTYINSCSWAKWKKYTSAEKLSLVLDLEGSYNLCFVGYTMQYREVVRKEFGVLINQNSPRRQVRFEFDDNDETIIGVELTAFGKSTIYGGYYEAGYSGDLNPVHISLSTTTCRKEEFIKKNIKLIKDKILNGDDELKDNLTVHVVDNGRTLSSEDIEGEHVILHPNPNTGGSGGFARGMIESLYQESPATHVLLMDDDVLVLPESIKRTYHLLRLLKSEYKDHFISGAMLRYEKPLKQHEDIGTVSEEVLFKPLKPPFNQSKISSLVENEAAYYHSNAMFSAWWYCCIPINKIKENGLPMPLFIRGDDCEYSLRCRAKFISLNGIFVWHMGFAMKFSAAMDIYQQFRNLMIAADSTDAFVGINMFTLFKTFYKREMLKFNYNAVELMLRAFEDYMKGPSYLENCDGEAIVKENIKLNEKYEPLSAHPEIEIYDIEDCYEDAPRRAKDKLLYHLTLNGQKHCPAFLIKKGGKLPLTAFDFSIQTQKISMVKNYAVVNPYDETVAIRTLDKKRFRELDGRFRRDEKRFAQRHEALRRAYRKAHPYLTSEAFWRKYLGM